MIDITDQPVDPALVSRAVWTPADGAVVTFTGIVRDHDGGRTVHSLEYSAHPLAPRLLRELCAELASGDGDRVAVVHRVGQLAIGDVAVAVAVSTPHRGRAFELCSTVIDRVKHQIPIWKRQRFADGLSEWVGAGSC